MKWDVEGVFWGGGWCALRWRMVCRIKDWSRASVHSHYTCVTRWAGGTRVSAFSENTWFARHWRDSMWRWCEILAMYFVYFFFCGWLSIGTVEETSFVQGKKMFRCRWKATSWERFIAWLLFHSKFNFTPTFSTIKHNFHPICPLLAHSIGIVGRRDP